MTSCENFTVRTQDMNSTGTKATARRPTWWRLLATGLARITGYRLLPWHKRLCPVTNDRQKLGQFAENAACSFLRRNGLRILRRNFRTEKGELDIIACDGDVLVIVEVRSRSSDARGTPAESINRKKRARIARATHAWLLMHEGKRFNIRFDIVEVFLAAGDPPVLRHTANAFDLPPQYLY